MERREYFILTVFEYSSVLIEDLLGKLLITKNTVTDALTPYILTRRIIPDSYNSFSLDIRVKPIVISRVNNLTHVVSP